jgi:hypothetical protein
LALVHCRGLIYQALPPGDSSVGFDESNPYYQIYIHFFFVVLRVLRGYFHSRQSFVS